MKKRRKQDKTRGVIYIGHVPHGFYEDQMRRFLQQYGGVSRLRISRSKKTGKVHGYAFAQFADPDAAEHVAEELHGTYLTNRVLQVKVVAPEKVHPNLWKGMKTSILQKKDEDMRINGPIVHYQPASEKTVEQRLLGYVDREREMNAKLKAAGIDYEFHGFENQLDPLGITYVPKKVAQAATAAAKKPGKGILDKLAQKALKKKKKSGAGGKVVLKKRKKAA